MQTEQKIQLQKKEDGTDFFSADAPDPKPISIDDAVQLSKVKKEPVVKSEDEN